MTHSILIDTIWQGWFVLINTRKWTSQDSPDFQTSWNSCTFNWRLVIRIKRRRSKVKGTVYLLPERLRHPLAQELERRKVLGIWSALTLWDEPSGTWLWGSVWAPSNPWDRLEAALWSHLLGSTSQQAGLSAAPPVLQPHARKATELPRTPARLI